MMCIVGVLTDDTQSCSWSAAHITSALKAPASFLPSCWRSRGSCGRGGGRGVGVRGGSPGWRGLGGGLGG